MRVITRTRYRRRVRIVVSGLTVAASIAVAGCSTSLSSVPPTPAEVMTPSAAPGFRYEDAAAGFAITFPGQFTVAPVSGDTNGAMRASYSTTADETAADGVFYVAGATTAVEVEIDHDSLEGSLYHMIISGGSLKGLRDVDLDGVPAMTAELPGPDGKEETVTVAGEGHTYYQFVVIGGTKEQRQQFIDTFERLG